ncbi:BZ3500_MvSof-1268-A1-R1_Chr3-1g05507 [Microbotryum saponariae]|uniref:BZ3500_MvSof-1268-A1-R1_Chr3-1g05507 protein n=1 Tax=Microbotryum saponariae TaxID=289078 RepID=A0A2X0LI39_9BASI|nr:BZ3500_MvSof-1268-A1-R1_Chr3-1g05507 [Microbotryum saponariae]SDA04698.1 BZ3501_MvSof-1269-A2-R1_Chr3-1g05178 [Microbotryum saponariae]
MATPPPPPPPLPPLPSRPSSCPVPAIEHLSLNEREDDPPIASTSTAPPPAPPTASSSKAKGQVRRGPPITYRRYTGEEDIPLIIALVETELSEPYNWYTYRYFLQDCFRADVLRPHLCFFAYMGDAPIGTIVCKQDLHKKGLERGYIAMLAVVKSCRGRGVATRLVQLSITEMVAYQAQEVMLETEFDNVAALTFYERLGFFRDKRLFRFYLNAKDAFRLKLPLAERETEREEMEYRARLARIGVDEELTESLEVWKRWKEGTWVEEGEGRKGEGKREESAKGPENEQGTIQESSGAHKRSEAANT